jgi:hypothetical protein
MAGASQSPTAILSTRRPRGPLSKRLGGHAVRLCMERGEIVLQQAMDDPITPSTSAQENALGGIIQEIRVAPRCGAVKPER